VYAVKRFSETFACGCFEACRISGVEGWGTTLLKAFVKKQKNQSFFIVDFIKNHSFFTKNL